MEQLPTSDEKEDPRPPEDQGDNSLVIDEEKPNEGSSSKLVIAIS